MSEKQLDYKDHLESERLVTRFLTAEDAVAWNEFFQDKEAIELFPALFVVPGQDNGTPWVARQLQRYQTNKLGLQALIEKTSGAFIGQCGLMVQEVDGIQEIEVGYHIFKRHWGHGYAPEAARIFIDFAFANGITSSVISIIDTRNSKSMRVAEKNGLRREKQTTWNGMNVYIYRISKPD